MHHHSGLLHTAMDNFSSFFFPELDFVFLVFRMYMYQQIQQNSLTSSSAASQLLLIFVAI
jgi:hypothetical protein